MYLRVKGGPFTCNLFREIETITDRATLQCDSAKYDAEGGIVTVNIYRYPIKVKRKLIWFTPYSRDKSAGIKSLITVRNVETCSIEHRFGLKEATVLFGVGVKGKTIIISSAEESEGLTAFLITMTVSELDLEIEDISS